MLISLFYCFSVVTLSLSTCNICISANGTQKNNTGVKAVVLDGVLTIRAAEMSAQVLADAILGLLGPHPTTALVVAAGTTADSTARRSIDTLRTIPLLLGVQAIVNDDKWKNVRPQSSPSVLLLPLGVGRPRVLLSAALKPLQRQTAPWAREDAWVVLLCDSPPSRKEAAAIQRALARAGVWRGVVALGVDSGSEKGHESSSPNSLEHTENGKNHEAVVWAFEPSRRPYRKPLEVHASKFNVSCLSLWPDVSGHSIVFAIHTNSLEEEHLCLNGSVPYWTDVLVDIALTIATTLGARPLCYSKAWEYFGSRRADGSYSGLVESVIRGRAEVMLHDPQTNAEWARDASLFYPHDVEGFCVYVPKAQPIPFFQCLLRAYKGALDLARDSQVDVWALIGGSLAALATTQALGGVRDPLFTTYRAFLVGSFSRSRRSARYLAMALMTAVFGVLTLCVFQSTITSYITTPRYFSQIDSLHEIADKFTTVYAIPEWVSLIRLDDSPNMKRIANLAQPIEHNWYYTVSTILQDGNKAVILSDRQSYYFLNYLPFTRCGYSLLHRSKECIVTVAPKNFVARKNSPYFLHMDLIARRLVEAGISIKFWKHSEVSSAKRFNLVRTQKGSEVLRPYSLSMNHVLNAFIVLHCGYVISATIFIIECILKVILGKHPQKKKLAKRNRCWYLRISNKDKPAWINK